jgi:hypothetical protein
MATPQNDDVFSRRSSRRDPWLERLGYFRKYKLAPFLAAILIGLAQMYVLVRLWGYISIYTPLPNWLLGFGLGGTSLHVTVFLSDALCNVLFCLPAAYAIYRLKPPRRFVYLTLAIVPGFIWQYRLFLGDPTLLKDWPIFIPGAVLTLAPLPLATLAIQRTLGQHSPNNRWRVP